MDTYGAETLSSYPGLDSHTHTHAHAHRGEDCGGHTSLKMTLILSFVPWRHFNVKDEPFTV